MTEKLRHELIETLTWMIDTFKWEHEQSGLGGSYSDELQAAIRQLEELKREK